jgi:hypothetical protein
MNRKELVAILQDPSHPKRSEMASLVAEFLSQGIAGICFGVQLDKVPGEQRREKVAQALQGLTNGEEAGTAEVVKFFNDNVPHIPIAFTFYLQEKEEKAGSGALPFNAVPAGLLQ